MYNFGYIDIIGIQSLQKTIIDSGCKLNLILALDKDDYYTDTLMPFIKNSYTLTNKNATLYDFKLDDFFKDSDFVVFNCLMPNIKNHIDKLVKLSKKYNTPIINIHPNNASRLELDRDFGKKMAKDFGVKPMPYIKSLNKEELKNFIKKYKKVVFKSDSPDCRVYIPFSTQEALDIIEYDLLDYIKNKSCIIEKFISGPEECVCFYFNDKGIVGNCLMYVQEHKQLFDGDKSNVLAGEVGAAFKIESFDKATPYIKTVTNKLCLYLKDIGYRGYISFNCIKTKKSEPVLLEFTCREGYPTQAFIPFITPNYGDFYACVAGLKETVKIKEGYYCAICFNSGTLCSEFNDYDAIEKRFPIYGMDENCLLLGGYYTKDGKLPIHNFCDRELLVVGYNKNSFKLAQKTAYKSASKVKTFGLSYRKDIGHKWVEPSEFFK